MVEGSTPVIAFGEFPSARIATLGLNPSRQEFQSQIGIELAGDIRRFETHRSLGVDNLESAEELVLQRVYDGCCHYFSRKPYRWWFDQLERIIKPLGASYYEGSACHLDLVQWATDPVWGKLHGSVQQRLLESDSPFLLHQLQQGQVRVLLLNGSSVVRSFQDIYCVPLKDAGRLTGPTNAPSKLVIGRMAAGPLVIGWTMNIQSSFGVSSRDRSDLASAVHRIATEAGYVPGAA